MASRRPSGRCLYRGPAPALPASLSFTPSTRPLSPARVLTEIAPKGRAKCSRVGPTAATTARSSRPPTRRLGTVAGRLGRRRCARGVSVGVRIELCRGGRPTRRSLGLASLARRLGSARRHVLRHRRGVGHRDRQRISTRSFRVVGWAHETGATTVDLWVSRGNDAAVRLYEAGRFQLTGGHQPLPSDPCKDELRMRCSLA